MPEQEEIVPTLLIGLGGTGHAVLTRVFHRLQTVADRIPVWDRLGFLLIDTIPEVFLPAPAFTLTSPAIIETYCASVSPEEAYRITRSPTDYPWLHQWLPLECISQPELLNSETSTKQVRPAGRLAFAFHYEAIRQTCEAIQRRISSINSIQKSEPTARAAPKFNVIIVASTAGGTGGGMFIDLGYALQQWFQPQTQLETTLLLSTPDLFASTTVDWRIKENTYAALVELNYYSNSTTVYLNSYGNPDERAIHSSRPPYDFCYIVGSNGQGTSLSLEAIWDKMAQALELDLRPDYGVDQQRLRNPIWQQVTRQVDALDPEQFYPRNFLSFGIATAEIPVRPIVQALTARLAADLCEWWLNGDIDVPTDLSTRLKQDWQERQWLGKSLRTAIFQSPDGRPYSHIIQLWFQGLTAAIAAQNYCQCTAQLPHLPPFAQETGNILHFVQGYLQPRIKQLWQDYLHDYDADGETHGAYLQQMKENGDRIVQSVITELQEQIQIGLSDRGKGPVFLQALLQHIDALCDAEIQELEQEEKTTWRAVEHAALSEYGAICIQMGSLRTQWLAQKQAWMEQRCEQALMVQRKAAQACLERHVRSVAAHGLQQIRAAIAQWQLELNQWFTRITSAEAYFRQQTSQILYQAMESQSSGFKLFQKPEFEQLYARILNTQAGLEPLCQFLTEQVLQVCHDSPGWLQSPEGDRPMQLWDVEQFGDTNSQSLDTIILKAAQRVIEQTLDADSFEFPFDIWQRLQQRYPTLSGQRSQLILLLTRSRPLVKLEHQAQRGAVRYVEVAQLGLAEDTGDDVLPVLEQVMCLAAGHRKGLITFLPPHERHRAVALHLVGGFSLRCLTGIVGLRRAYIKWRGKQIRAEQARLRGQPVTLPAPLHTQAEDQFGDLMPGDKVTEELVMTAHILGILQETSNTKLQKRFVCYMKPAENGAEVVLLGRNLDETAQTLELLDFQDDRREIQRQLEETLERVKTEPQRQALRTTLETYLKQSVQNHGLRSKSSLHSRKWALVERLRSELG